jgi:hypothetical protein
LPACALTVARGGEGQNENIEELTIELDENLRRHRPRAGRVEEDVARAREVQLLEQARRANNFVKTNIRLVQKQQVRRTQSVSGAASRQLVVPRRWGTRLCEWCKWSCLSTTGGTRLGVWSRPPAQTGPRGSRA